MPAASKGLRAALLQRTLSMSRLRPRRSEDPSASWRDSDEGSLQQVRRGWYHKVSCGA